MKTAILGLVGLSLLAGLAAPAGAEAGAKKKRYHAAATRQPYSQGAGPKSDYTERLADKLPFGSGAWWDQMSRERRGGRAGG